jgi:hypothetical protein
MVLHITSHEITSGCSEHRAWRAGKAWRVSWARGREFSKNEAIAAMTVAELLRSPRLRTRDLITARALLDELGLTMDDFPVRGDRA